MAEYAGFTTFDSIVKTIVSFSFPMVAHSPSHTNSVLVMFEKFLNIIVSLGYE